MNIYHIELHHLRLLRADNGLVARAELEGRLSALGVAQETRLRELFGLTRTEAAVAEALARGASPETIAAEMGVGLATVRTHLKRILAKTGCMTRASLVAGFWTRTLGWS